MTGAATDGANARPRFAALAAWRALVGSLLIACVLATAPARAAVAETDPSGRPAKVDDLLKLLADPQVRGWLDRHAGTGAPPTEPQPAAGARPSLTNVVSERLKAIREHFVALAETFPKMPSEYQRAKDIFEEEYDNDSRLWILFLVGAFVALGFVAEWIFWWLCRPFRKSDVDLGLDNVGARLRTVVRRFLLGLGLIASSTLGSVGVFLAVDWPDLLKEILLTYLMAFLVIRLTIVIGRFLLSPPEKFGSSAARFRLVPVNDRAALFWHQTAIVAVAWMVLGSATIQLLGTFGFSPMSRTVLFDGLMLGLMAIGIVSLWLTPVSFYDASRLVRRWNPRSIATFGTLLFFGLWLLWVADFHGAFALLLVAFGLPTVIAIAQRSVNHILRPAGAEEENAEFPSVQAIVFERGVRALLIAGAAYLLGLAWQVDLTSLTMQDTAFTRILRDLLNAVVIFLVADLAWHVTVAAIGKKLNEVGGSADPHGDSERNARRRTLLPILRNVMLVTIVIVSAMVALAGMGVAVGPLIASAGVLGVAVGFGSQTLVRDIISGIFYLFDDAFRVGEYIQSGSYKGTVEAFSLRSVKLRHHRGPLYTVPFGSLGAIQNMSRDWTIEKVTIGVTYDTDVAKVKRLVKQIGQKLLEDPELAPSIIETLKLQGIQSFGDYGIQLRVKIMTRAGEQFVVRRRALALIKTTFDANGITFAFPLVHVAGGPEAEGAAAQRHLETNRTPRAAE